MSKLSAAKYQVSGFGCASLGSRIGARQGIETLERANEAGVNQFGNRDDVYASRFGFEIHLSSRAKKPVVLVGHSYGGAVITEAGDLPKVQSLIYLAAYAPQAGESVFDIATAPTTGEDKAPLLPPSDNFLLCDSEKFLTSFAAGVDPKTARFMRRYPGVWEPCRQRSPPPPGRTSRPISW